MSETSPPQPPILLNLFGRTDVGRIREHNEDNFFIADLTRKTRGLMEADRQQIVGRCGTVFGVCDGMGGAAAGEVASQMAVDIIYDRLANRDEPASGDDLALRMVRAIEEAGLQIFNDARADRTHRGMGTTSTVAVLCDTRLFLGQVGDSRAYLLRQGRLVQVTRDQSLVNQLIEAGQLTEEEAETFEHNNIILQALGTSDTVQVDLTYVDLRRGDTLLMCSDGLSGMIRADDIREALATYPDPLEACKVLTDRANEAGGHDNITVIVVKFEGEALAEVSATDEALVYRKYPLPDAPQPAAPVPGVPSGAPSAPLPVEPPAHSEGLKVGHTMVGVMNPLVQAQLPESAPAGSLAASAPPPPPSFDDPVVVPTSGLPPRLIGAIVLGAMLFLLVAGIVLLR